MDNNVSEKRDDDLDDDALKLGNTPKISKPENELKLTRLHLKIINEAHNIIQDHRPLDSLTLYKTCRRNMKDENLRLLNQRFAELFKMKFLVQGRVVTYENIFDNQNRTKIFRLIELNPGINIGKIKSYLGLNLGTIKWHLKMLEEFGLIRMEIIKNQKTFFEISLDSSLDSFYFVLNKSGVLDVIKKILNAPKCTFADLCEVLQMKEYTIRRRIKELKSLGILKIKKRLNRVISIDIFDKFKPILYDYVLSTRTLV